MYSLIPSQQSDAHVQQLPPTPRLSLCCVGFGFSGVILLYLLTGLFFSSPLHIFLGVLEVSQGRCVRAVSSGVGSDE